MPVWIYDKLFNFILFQLIWLACVIYGNTGLYLALPLFFVLLTNCTLAYPNPRFDYALSLYCGILGLLVDGLLIKTGVFILSEARQPAYWLWLIWFSFGLTLQHSLKPIIRLPKVAALAGLIFGPLAYHAGFLLGAIKFNLEPVILYSLLALIWSVLMFALSHFIQRQHKTIEST